MKRENWEIREYGDTEIVHEFILKYRLLRAGIRN